MADYHTAREDRPKWVRSEKRCEDGDNCETVRVVEGADTIADVLPQLVEPDEAPYLPSVFLDPRYVAEFSNRGVARPFGRHAAIDVVLHLSFDVVAAAHHDPTPLVRRPKNPGDASREPVPFAGLDR